MQDFNVGLGFWLFVMSVGASALGGMVGMASGIFIVPLLTQFGGVDLRTAIGASIVSVIACSCASAASFLERGLTNIRLAIVLETATTLGALTGVFFVGIAPASFLYGLFAVVLLLSAHQMLATRGDPATTAMADTAGDWAGKLGLHASYTDRALGRSVTYQVRRLPRGMVLMYGAGLVSALLGIGSGVLKVPAMDTALRLPIKVSSATSNFMIGVTAAASAAAYCMRGFIVPSIAGPVVLGSVLGSVIGARILMRVSNEKVRVLFVVVLMALAVQMLLSAFHIGLFGKAA
jgi:uncharacterized protein